MASRITLDQSQSATSPALCNSQKLGKAEQQAEEPSCAFRLTCRNSEEVGAVLGLSMPADSTFPAAFLETLQGLPEKALLAIVQDPAQAHGRFISEVKKKNRKNWTKLVNAGKADAVLRAAAQEQVEAEAKHEEEVMQERRQWLNKQLQLLLKKRTSQHKA